MSTSKLFLQQSTLVSCAIVWQHYLCKAGWKFALVALSDQEPQSAQFHIFLRLGRGLLMEPGHGLSRLQVFLLSSLKPSTIEKYTQALQDLNNELEEQNVVWAELTEEEQDYFLADMLLDAYESDGSRVSAGWLLSALQKVYPRLKLKVAWRVFDTWGLLQPSRQAPAAPPELLHAMFATALMLNRPVLSGLLLVCYCGLLRVREGLGLRGRDLVLQTDGLTLCLGKTKRGMEQKVVLRNGAVISYMRSFFEHCGYPASDEFVFPISYGSVLRWVKRLSELLGAKSLQLTTHTLRRSGASELSRQGMPLADILLYGRRLSEKAAREYIRKGEVAIIRSRGLLQVEDWARIDRWSAICNNAWKLYHLVFSQTEVASLRLGHVTCERFRSYESLVFQLCTT